MYWDICTDDALEILLTLEYDVTIVVFFDVKIDD